MQARELKGFKETMVASRLAPTKIPPLSPTVRSHPTRKFHTLLLSEATLCAEVCHAGAAPWNFRVKHKTAMRFCLSPHERKATAKKPTHRASGRCEDQSECAIIDPLRRGLRRFVVAWAARSCMPVTKQRPFSCRDHDIKMGVGSVAAAALGKCELTRRSPPPPARETQSHVCLHARKTRRAAPR